jgi:hypothetical protein
MAQNIIDIGIQGNDGTGDSIRESFNKVNANFNELYAVFGVGGFIKFGNLADAPGTTGFTTTTASANGTQVTLYFTNPNPGLGLPYNTDENIVVTGCVPAGYNGNYVVTSATTNSVTFNSAVTGTLTTNGKISGTSYSKNQIIMGSTTGSSLTARTLTAGIGINIDTTSNQEVVIASTAIGLINDAAPSMGAPINANLFTIGRLSNPSADLVAAFNAVYASQGVSTTLGQLAVTVDYADTNYLKAVNGQVTGALRVRAMPTTAQTNDPDYDSTLTGNYVATEAIQRKHAVLRDGDSMTGALTLSDHPGSMKGFGVRNGADDLQAASKFYVDNNTYYSTVNLYVSTVGDDTQKNTPLGREGRAWHYAYRTLGAALLQAQNVISTAFSEPGPYRQTIAYTIGPNQYKSQLLSVNFTGGNNSVQGYQDASVLLENNKSFIQNETIAYLNQKYVNTFTFDKTRYSNIIQNIVNAVGYDLALGTNFNSTTQGSILFNAYNSDVSSSVQQITAAINYARDQILSYAYSTTGLQNYISNVIDAVCYDLEFGSNYQSIQVALAFKYANTGVEAVPVLINQAATATTGVAKATVGSITGNTMTIAGTVTGVWAVGMTVTGFGVPANTVITAFALGTGGVGTYIVTNLTNATVATTSLTGTANTITVASTTSMTVGSQITFTGTTFGNIVSGTTYYILSIVDSTHITVSSQLNGTVFGLLTATGTMEANTTAPSEIAGVLSNLATNINALSPISSSTTLQASITSILTNISNIIVTGVVPNPTFTPVVASSAQGQISAVTLLLNNINFIQAEIVAYLLANYPTLTYSKTTCQRDVKYIVWALCYDITYGGNSESVYAGLQYWINSVLQIQSYEQTATVSAIGYINTLAQAIIINQPPATLYQIGVIQYANNTYSNGSVASNSISLNISTIQSIVGSASKPTPAVTAPTTGAVASTLINAAAAITSAKSALETAAVTYTNTAYPTINDGVQQSTINSLFGTITNLVINGISSRSTPTYTNPNGLSSSIVHASAAILANIPFITSEVNAWINANYSGTTYNTVSSKRDLTYVLEAIAYDLNYGGNSATAQAANQYYANNTAQLVTGLPAVCAAAIGRALNVVTNIISNSIVSPTTGNYISTTGSSGSGTYATLTFAAQGVAPYTIGQIIAVQGMSPTGYNGYWTVTNCTTTSVTFANSTIGNQTIAGEITNQVLNNTWPDGSGQTTTVTTLFNIVLGVINTNALYANAVYPSVTNSNSAYTTFNIIESNSYTIATATVNYLTTTFAGGFTYNQATCFRDIGYIIDGQIIDLLTDGTYQSITAGKSYYKNVSAKSIAIGTQYTETIDGIQFAQSLALQVLNQTTKTRYQTLVTQYTNGALNATVGTNIATATYVSNTTNSLTITSLAGVLVPGMVLTGTGWTNATPVTIVAVTSPITVSISAPPAGTPSGGITFTATPVTTLNANMNTIVSIIANGIGAAPVPSFGTGYYTLTFDNGGNGFVDQGEPGANHILPNKILVGNQSSAYGQIVSYIPGTSVSYDTITLNMTRPGFFKFVATTASGTIGSFNINVASTTYATNYNSISSIVVGMGAFGVGIPRGALVTQVSGLVITLNLPITSTLTTSNITFGELLDFGEQVADQNITVFVESGIYYEDYPLKMSANVTISGDDFRRTIIRPLDRISQSPWRSVFFYRDSIIDGMQIGLINFSGTDFAAVTNSTATISGVTGSITITLGAGQTASPSWIGYVFTDGTNESVAGGTSSQDGLSPPGKAVVVTVSGNTMTCTVVYPFPALATYSAGTWHMYNTLNYGRHYLSNPLDINSTPLNNKLMDVFLVNDATRIKLISAQGHGGFMMVLDPEGQIKTKSPYGQESASFSGSINKQRFAGGQFIDGFAGRLFGTITGIANTGYQITVTGSFNSGLDVRPPQTPTAFYVLGTRYQVNNVVSWNSNTYTTVLNLDTSTPFYPQTTYSSAKLSTNIYSTSQQSIIEALAFDMALSSTATMASSTIGGTGGTTLTVGTVSAGTIYVGMFLTGTGVTSGTYITANISGSTGAGSTWSVNIKHTGFASTTITGTLYSNYKSVAVGQYFLLPTYSVIALSKALVINSYSYVGNQITALGLSTLNTLAVKSNVTTITNIISNGVAGASTQSTVIPTLQFPIPSGSSATTDNVLASKILQANRIFLQNEMSAFIASTANLGSITGYSALKSQRDIGYIIDAITYDALYGGNSAIYDIASTFFVNSVSQLYGGNQAVCLSAWNRLSSILPNLLGNVAITVSTGNNIAQVTSLQAPASPSTQASAYSALITILYNTVNNGSFGAVVRTNPTISGNTDFSNIYTTNGATIVSNTLTYVYGSGGVGGGAGIGINLETAGNKSMLANDFTQINDLGYGIFVTNAGLTEQVSTFTYYCYTAYWALNGGQIRSVAGSNSNGVYGLRGTGSDVTELPNYNNMSQDMAQSARIYNQGAYFGSMLPTVTSQVLSIYVTGYSYVPYNTTELEIDHTLAGGGIVRYLINSASKTPVSYNGQTVLQLTLSTSGTNNTSSNGLSYPVYDGQVVTLRVLQNIKFYNIDNVRPVRPSTALQYQNNLAQIYRIIAYNLVESTGEALPPHSAILGMDTSFAYYKFVVDTNNFGNADPTVYAGTATAIYTLSTPSSLVVSNSSKSGTITTGQIIGGYGFKGNKITGISVGSPSAGYTTITFNGLCLTTPVGPVYFSTVTQGNNLGDNKISVLQVADATTIAQINSGTYIFAWNGRTHRVISYVVPVSTASGVYTASSYASLGGGSYTITVSSVAGTITKGQLITCSSGGTVYFDGTQVVSSVVSSTSAGGVVTSVVTFTGAVTNTLAGTPSITFGVYIVPGYLQLDSNPVNNIGSTGTAVGALTYVSNTLATGSTVQKLVTFNIPYNNLLAYPPVDSFLTVANQVNTNYNGNYQVTAIANTTQLTLSGSNINATTVTVNSSSGTTITLSTTPGLTPGATIIFSAAVGSNVGSGTTYYVLTNVGASLTISSVPGGTAITVGTTTGLSITGTVGAISGFTTNLTVGMVISTSTTGAFIPTTSSTGINALTNPSGITIIQSIDSTTKFTVSPAVWIPSGITVNCQVVATVSAITITNSGSGYATAPSITFSGGGATSQATASCTINSTTGAIASVTIISPGYGYTSTPTITLSSISGTVVNTIGGTTNAVTLNSVSGIIAGTAITFGGTSFDANITVGVTYYVIGTVGNQITLSSTPQGITPISLVGGTGSNMTWSTPGTGILTPVLTSNPVQVVTGGAAGLQNLQATLLYPTDPGSSGTVVSTASPSTVTLSSTSGMTVGNDIYFSAATTNFGGVLSSIITAGAFVIGNSYIILSIGTTNYTLIGATANIVGLRFTATATGAGTGTAQPVYYIASISSPSVTLALTRGGATITNITTVASVTSTTFYTPSFNYGSSITVTSFTSSVLQSSGTYNGMYYVTFAYSGAAQTTGVYYYVAGNSNNLFNGYYLCIASSSNTITLVYTYSPTANSNTYGSGTTTITKEVTNATSSSLGISKPFNVNYSTTLRIGYAQNAGGAITVRISTCRATGHDFLDIGTGGFITSNYPNQIYGNAIIPATQSNQVLEETVGRVFYVTTDQNGIFKVGRFFQVDQGTGTVTFSASIALSNLDGLGFKRGVVVAEFSTDGTMTGNASDTVPVQSAVRSFVDYRLGIDYSGAPVASNSLIGPGFLALNGTLAMKGNLNMSNYSIGNVGMPVSGVSQYDAANRGYVDGLANAVNNIYKFADVAIKATGNYSAFGVSPPTLTVTNLFGTVVPGMFVTGTGFTSGQYVVSVSTTPGTIYTGATVVAVLNASYTSTPSGTITFTNQSNGNFMVYDSTFSQWTNIALPSSTTPSGSPAGSHIGFTFTHGTPGTITTTIQAGTIVDSMVNAAAAIAQSKLLLQATATLANAPVAFTQSAAGIATFNSNAFTTTNGWVDHLTSSSTTTGITLNKLAYMSSGYVLGNRSGNAASPGLITPGNVVADGDGIKNALFNTANSVTTNSSANIMLTLYDGSNTSNNTYGVIGITTNGAVNKIVKTDSSGNIAAASSYTANGTRFVGSSGTTVTYYTPAQVTAMTIADINSSSTTTINGVLNAAGTLITTTLNAGSTVGTAGTLSGQWSLGSLSSFDASAGTLKSSNLTTGSSANAGTFTGLWTFSQVTAFTGSISANGGINTNDANIAAGNGTVSAATVTATTLNGTLGTAAQPNITSVGTLSNLGVSGAITTTNITTGSSLTAGTFTGTWDISGTLKATYADLAEFYEGDQEYEAGTVLVFGGDKEVTTTNTINDTRSAGVVTTDPAYVMNSGQTGIKVCIALAGRVPVKVVGRVKKGDMLTTSATPGYAVKALTPTLGAVIGKALEDKDYGEAGVIQIAVGRV